MKNFCRLKGAAFGGEGPGGTLIWAFPTIFLLFFIILHSLATFGKVSRKLIFNIPRPPTFTPKKPDQGFENVEKQKKPVPIFDVNFCGF